MSSLYIGVDPGNSGAMAFISDGKLLDVFKMPLRDIGVTKERNIIDLGKLYAFFAPFEKAYDRNIIALVEDVHAMPKQGVTSTFTFGRALGAIEGFLQGKGILQYSMQPKAWQTIASVSSKKSSIDIANTRFKDYFTMRAKPNKDHNISDAVLIAWVASIIYGNAA